MSTAVASNNNSQEQRSEAGVCICSISPACPAVTIPCALAVRVYPSWAAGLLTLLITDKNLVKPFNSVKKRGGEGG